MAHLSDLQPHPPHQRKQTFIDMHIVLIGVYNDSLSSHLDIEHIHNINT